MIICKYFKLIIFGKHAQDPTDDIYEVVSFDNPLCPDCNNELKFFNTRFRQYINPNKFNKRQYIIIRVLKCVSCGKFHNEIPIFLVPYKRHVAETISSYLKDPNIFSASEPHLNFNISSPGMDTFHEIIGQTIHPSTTSLDKSTVGHFVDWFDTISLNAVNFIISRQARFPLDDDFPIRSFDELMAIPEWLSYFVFTAFNFGFLKKRLRPWIP
jgi:hypothetical protein